MVLWLIPFLTLRGTTQLLSTVAAPFCIPTSNTQTRIPVSLQPCQHLLFSVFLSLGVLEALSWDRTVMLAAPLVTDDLFMCLEDQVHIFGETSIQVPLPMFRWAVCFFVWGLKEIFI